MAEHLSDSEIYKYFILKVKIQIRGGPEFDSLAGQICKCTGNMEGLAG